MKAAIYARVSTDKQDEEYQVNLCREHCLRAGYQIYATYCDHGVTGKKASRPSWNALLDDMRHYKFNCLIVTRLSRIARSLDNLIDVVLELKNKGVHFVCVSQDIDTTTANGRFVMHIFGALDELQGEMISENTKEGLIGKVNVGKRGPDKKPRLKRGGIRKPLIYLEKDAEHI